MKLDVVVSMRTGHIRRQVEILRDILSSLEELSKVPENYCENCGTELVVLAPIGAVAVKECPKCGEGYGFPAIQERSKNNAL